MKMIAIPTNGEQIEDHFGQCKFYTLVKVSSDNKIVSQESFPTPQGCGCKSNLVEILAEKGVNIMIAGNMGQGAKNVLGSAGIKVLCGFSGSIEQALDLYLNKGFKGDEKVCEHHHHAHGDHGCNH
jgi:predicted Fe-Mo cluster-binding NifX family protein